MTQPKLWWLGSLGRMGRGDRSLVKGEHLDRRVEGASQMMTRVGQRFGIQWLIYNPIEFYRYYLFASSTRNAVADSLVQVFSDASSFADVGAGPGSYAAGLRHRGRRVVACENSRIGRWLTFLQGVRSRPFDLNLADPSPGLPLAEVGYCFEVAEHLPPALGDRLVSYLARFPTVLLSAAHPGQGGLGHINEQPQDYWIERFAGCGFSVDAGRTGRIVEAFRARGAPWWLTDNAVVFRRVHG